MIYSDLKALISKKGLAGQFQEFPDRYNLWARDGYDNYESTIYKSNALIDGIDAATEAANISDFETNYKAKWNSRVHQIDTDGATLSRIKVAPTGWNFNFRMMEFRTSTLASVVNRATDGVTNLTDATLSLYDVNNVLITDPALAANCVKSTLDIEPPYDYHITGGNVRTDAQAAVNIYVNVIAVPDVPAASGGSKSFVQNVNMKYVNPSVGVEADGRAAKLLQYSATYHTNKLRFQFTHPAGYQLGIAVILELYKP